MAESLGRMLNYTVRKIGIGTMVGFSLLVVLLSGIGWWLTQFVGRDATPALGSLILLALILGWLLARSQISGRIALVLVMVAGFLV